jgi:hypothetical protein
MPRAVAVLFALLVVVQESSESVPERLLRQTDEAIIKATTLEWKVKGSVVTPNGEYTFEGSGGLGSNECFKLEALVSPKGDSKKQILSRVTSNGTKYTITKGPPDKHVPSEAKEIPAGISRRIRVALTRLSHMGVLDELVREVANPPRNMANEPIAMGDLKSLGKEKVGDVEGDVIEFALKGGDAVYKVIVKLWMDPKNHLPLKRMVSFSGDGGTVMQFTEEYKEFTTSPTFAKDYFELTK